jgi:DNA invertase Pin-like site-specific DNA recombinase
LVALRSAAERHRWTIVKELPLKMSAWDSAGARDAQRRALEPIERGEADLLAVWSWDRLSREGIEGAFSLLRRLEDHLGAQFFSLQEPFLSTATASPEQRELMLSIIAWAAKWESQGRSERLKAKAESKRQRAHQLGERALWGRGRLASPMEVAEVRELAAKGLSVRGIGSRLGVSKSQVHRILKDVPP